MILKYLRLNNIRSYLDESVEFPEGSTLLSGDIGSGKSTILLAIDFALFGTRPGVVSGSDLLRNGKNSGFVELGFTIDGKDCVIRRSLKRGKSIAQESGSLAINGVESSYMPRELNSRIIEMFGYPPDALKKDVSLFNYTAYTPQEQMKQILLSGDRLETLRKIFNIDKYGRIKENAKLLLTELRAERRAAESSVSDLDAKIIEKAEKEKLRLEIENALSEFAGIEVAVNRRLEELEKEKESARTSISELYSLKQSLAGKEAELRMKERRIAVIDCEILDLGKKISDAETNRQEYGKITKPAEEEPAVRERILAIRKEVGQLAMEKAVLEKGVGELKNIFSEGECPVCGQKVYDKEGFESKIIQKSSRAEEITQRILDDDSRIHAMEKTLEEIRAYNVVMIRMSGIENSIRNFAENRRKLEEERSACSSDTIILENSVASGKSELGSLSVIENDYKRIEAGLREIQSKRMAVEREKSRLGQQLSDTAAIIASLERVIEEKKKAREKISRLSELISWSENYFVGLMGTIEKHVMMVIKQEFELLFQKWFSILIEDDLGVRLGDDFSPVIEQNGYETEYSNLSGGEKTSVALAYRLALNNVINSLIDSIKTKDIIILDEPTDGFSYEQLDKIRDVISELKLRQIIIVSHEPKMDSFVDSVIRVFKEQHVSRIRHV